MKFDVTEEVYRQANEPAKKATYLVPRVGALYPNLYVIIRYDLDEKGLFVWKGEGSVHCYFNQHGWTSTTGFQPSLSSLRKEMRLGRKRFEFEVDIQVTLGDAKGSAKVADSGIEFSAPRQVGWIHVEGYLENDGHGNVRS